MNVRYALLIAVLAAGVFVADAHTDEDSVSKDVIDNGKKIFDHNKKRSEEARTTVAIVYTTIGLGMVNVVIISAVWQGWLSGGFTFFERNVPQLKLEKLTPQWRLCVWLFVFLAAIELISWFGGLGGWFVIGCLFVLHAIIVTVVGATKKHADSSKVSHAAADDDTAENADDGDSDEKPAATNGAGWTVYPAVLGKTQKKVLLINAILLVVFSIVCLLVFYLWTPLDYQLFDLYYSEDVMTENAPGLTGKSILMMYAYQGLASKMEFNIYCRYLTTWCGDHYHQKLDTEAERKEKIDKSFIELYKINMTEYKPTSYKDYDSVNEWFIRELADGARTIGSNNSAPNEVVSPADARLTSFHHIMDDLKIWVKGENFNLEELLDDKNSKLDLSKKYKGGSMVIIRLAPSDYHRFHAPLKGTVKSVTPVNSGKYLSVNADSATAGNYAFYNERIILDLETDYGDVAYLAIGATCVGSVQLTELKDGKRVKLDDRTDKKGAKFEKGEELGYMQFGGSTIILIFPKDTYTSVKEIEYLTSLPVEMYVKMGLPIGTVKKA